MADETIIDKAIALIPGVSPKKRRKPAKTKPADHRKHLSAIQKNLAALAKDVEKLATVITGRAKAAKKAVARGPAKRVPKRKSSARKPSGPRGAKA
jgi:hypothetical protein